MTWINTVDGNLINLDLMQKIEFYHLEYKGEFLVSEIGARTSDGVYYLMSYADGHDAATNLLENVFLKKFHHMDYSFSDACRKLPEIQKIKEELPENWNHAQWEENFSKQQNKINQIHNSLVRVEIEIEMI